MFVKEFLPHIPQISCLIMCGLPASGKSTLARIISEGRGHLIVSTDMLRIRLYGEEVLDPQKAKDLSRRWQVYELMFEEAKRSADQGRGVILDGTFIKQGLRISAVEALKGLLKDFFIFHVRCEEGLILERIRLREFKDYESNALTPEAYFNNLREWEEIDLEALRERFVGLNIRGFNVSGSNMDPLLWQVEEVL